MAASPADSNSVRIFTEVVPADGQEAPGSSSRPTSFHVHHFRRAQPRVLGALHIVTGIIRFCCGILLSMPEYYFPPLAVPRGILLWLGVLLLVTGSLLVESAKRESILLVKTCCLFSVAVILSTLVAAVFHAVAIDTVAPACEQSWPYHREEFCFHTEIKAASDGLNAALAALSLLELCAAVPPLALGGGAAFAGRAYRRLAGPPRPR